MIPAYPSMGPLISFFQALLFNKPSVHHFLFEPRFVFLTLGYIICFQYFVGGPVPCVSCISDPRRGIVQESLEQSVWRPRIVHSRYHYLFYPNFNVVSEKRHEYKMGMILQTNSVESRSRMGPGWKICLLSLDICIGYFIKRFGICIAGFLGIVAVFYQVKQKQKQTLQPIKLPSTFAMHRQIK